MALLTSSKGIEDSAEGSKTLMIIDFEFDIKLVDITPTFFLPSQIMDDQINIIKFYRIASMM